MILKNDLYDYGLSIYQNDEYFKFSLDSILLAEFVDTRGANRLLDLCTGNAPIPLIISTKNKKIEIDAVEIQKEIYDLANKSIKESGFKSISVYNQDAKYFLSDNKYDIVTCNPPYFKYSDKSMINDNIIKRYARHEILINLHDIVLTANKNLKKNGKIYLVHRTSRLLDVLREFSYNNIGVRKICFIITSKSNKSEFFLIEGQLNRKDDPKIFVIDVRNRTTYKEIFKEV